jgi:hypothetical protein
MHQTTTFKELAHRAGAGVQVSLLWNSSDGCLTVVVDDAKTDERFALEAPPDNAARRLLPPLRVRGVVPCGRAHGLGEIQ